MPRRTRFLKDSRDLPLSRFVLNLFLVVARARLDTGDESRFGNPLLSSNRDAAVQFRHDVLVAHVSSLARQGTAGACGRVCDAGYRLRDGGIPESTAGRRRQQSRDSERLSARSARGGDVQRPAVCRRLHRAASVDGHPLGVLRRQGVRPAMAASDLRWAPPVGCQRNHHVRRGALFGDFADDVTPAHQGRSSWRTTARVPYRLLDAPG